MAKQIDFKIVTPEKVLYEGKVDSVSLPSVDGEITILPDHVPLISAIKPGELKIKKNGVEEFFSVTRGVVEVDGKNVVFLSDAAERSEVIDEKRAEEAVQRAQAIMAEIHHDTEGYAEAMAEMERALSRSKIARKHRHGSHPFTPPKTQ